MTTDARKAAEIALAGYDAGLPRYNDLADALRALLAETATLHEFICNPDYREETAPAPCPVDHSTCSRCERDTTEDQQVFVLCEPCWGATSPRVGLSALPVHFNCLLPRGRVFMHPDTPKTGACDPWPPPITPMPPEPRTRTVVGGPNDNGVPWRESAEVLVVTDGAPAPDVVREAADRLRPQIASYRTLADADTSGWSHDGRLAHERRLARMRDEMFPDLIAALDARGGAA